MAHKDSNWPKTELAKEGSDLSRELFNTGERKSLKKSGFCKIGYYNPKDIIFQILSVKETVFIDNKSPYEEIKCFRDGQITQHLQALI